jgi:hypothetical protein
MPTRRHACVAKFHLACGRRGSKRVHSWVGEAYSVARSYLIVRAGVIDGQRRYRETILDFNPVVESIGLGRRGDWKTHWDCGPVKKSYCRSGMCTPLSGIPVGHRKRDTQGGSGLDAPFDSTS